MILENEAQKNLLIIWKRLVSKLYINFDFRDSMTVNL